MSVAVAIEIGSPRSQFAVVQATVESIMANIGADDYKLIIAMTPSVQDDIKGYIHGLQREKKTKIELMPERDYFWADFINEAIDRASGFRYFIKAHDDVELLTPEFLPRVEKTLRSIRQPAGWVSFTDKDYLNGHWAPSTRPGYHLDYVFEKAWRRQKMFQFHSLPENWWRPPRPLYYRFLAERSIRHRLHLRPRPMPRRPRQYYANLPYDLPKGPVRCHAPFNHFVLIELEKLREIGRCENWGTHNALLVDEDWGLRALQLGLNNVWLPDIEYVHRRPGGGTRSWEQIDHDKSRVSRLFFEKWGFHSEGRAEELDTVKKRFGNTNITWSMDRRSYEWDYLTQDL
ncbi:MAG: hypothetical protein HYX91_01750 [Chloroflexi bacterium]|nr:hypothetical protein [Chloroflexota bacterium]